MGFRAANAWKNRKRIASEEYTMVLLRSLRFMLPLWIFWSNMAWTFADSVGDCIAIEFTSRGCSRCQEMHRSTDGAIQAGWVVRRFDMQQDAHMASRWQISSVPTTILVRNGREVDRILGAVSYRELSQRLIAASSADSLRLQSPSEPAAEATKSNRRENDAIVRGQSPAIGIPMATSLALASASHVDSNRPERRRPNVDPCMATVRIRVEDTHNESVGTGTIIDSFQGEALVLTCGHLFRESQGKAPITVETFFGGQIQKYTATLIDFQAKEVDIGLLSFRPVQEIAPVKLIPITKKLSEGQRVFSIGCDRGAPPSRIDSQVSKLNRYMGPPNVEVTGQPVEGRSGGGLFDDQGQLIGVCYAADPSLNEGLYNAADVVYQQLSKLGLQRLFNQEVAPPAAGLVSNSTNQDPSGRDRHPGLTPSPASQPQLAANGTPEMTVILKDSAGRQEYMHIRQPSPDLLQAVRDNYQR
jgi:hypothetical protein